VDTNRPRQFQKRRPLFFGMYNEPLAVAAMCVNNPDRLPFKV